jgi:hypothetical protein
VGVANEAYGDANWGSSAVSTTDFHGNPVIHRGVPRAFQVAFLQELAQALAECQDYAPQLKMVVYFDEHECKIDEQLHTPYERYLGSPYFIANDQAS